MSSQETQSDRHDNLTDLFCGDPNVFLMTFDNKKWLIFFIQNYISGTPNILEPLKQF